MRTPQSPALDSILCNERSEIIKLYSKLKFHEVLGTFNEQEKVKGSLIQCGNGMQRKQIEREDRKNVYKNSLLSADAKRWTKTVDKTWSTRGKFHG
jgi:hypothetical protein